MDAAPAKHQGSVGTWSGGDLGQRLSADIFNSAVYAFAIVAADEIDLLDHLDECGSVDIATYATTFDLHEPSLRSTVDALVCAGILRLSGNVATVTSAFPSVFETKGFFTWLLGGCGELLRIGGMITRNTNRKDGFINRDGRVISLAAADFGALFIDPVFDAAFTDHDYRRIVDLGCGSGARLVRALRTRPDATGIGIDVAPSAVELARERLAAEGLDDRAQVIRADVRDLECRPEFSEVDFVTCFLMGHDFWPQEECVKVLTNLRSAFPRVRTFALCDTYRSGIVPTVAPPILTLGFEHVHALMGQYVPSLTEWREVFGISGWRTVREHDLVLPPHSKIFHLTPAGDRLRERSGAETGVGSVA